MTSLRNQIDQAVASAVDRVVQSGDYRCYVGRESEQLEQELRTMFQHQNQSHHFLLTNSGTVALELALRSIGVVEGDQVILSGYDYPGNFWVVQQAKCTPVLVDVDCDSTRIDLKQLDAAFSNRTRALIVSHLHGQYQPIESLRKWCDKRGVVLIEDACQAIGGMLHQQPVGTFGHFALLSFGGSKVISAGRGGALITSDERLFQKSKIAAGAGSGAYALSELSAAVVRAQLEFLPKINQCSANYFSQIERALPPSLNRVYLGRKDSLDASDDQPAYYQAGWLLQNQQEVQSVVERLIRLDLTVGTGFPGFHRRSARRCRTVAELTNTAALVDRLFTMHFSAAIDPIMEPQRIASEIAEAVQCVR
ncbi:MAG: aminotransferase class V-fold PLP-dependent enzyme [Pirellulales bacterium]